VKLRKGGEFRRARCGGRQRVGRPTPHIKEREVKDGKGFQWPQEKIEIDEGTGGQRRGEGEHVRPRSYVTRRFGSSDVRAGLSRRGEFKQTVLAESPKRELPGTSANGSHLRRRENKKKGEGERKQP